MILFYSTSLQLNSIERMTKYTTHLGEFCIIFLQVFYIGHQKWNLQFFFLWDIIAKPLESWNPHRWLCWPIFHFYHEQKLLNLRAWTVEYVDDNDSRYCLTCWIEYIRLLYVSVSTILSASLWCRMILFKDILLHIDVNWYVFIELRD